MSKINIAFAVNDGYVEHLLIALYSLLKNNSEKPIEIFVLQKDFTETSREKVLGLEKRFKNASIKLVDMKEKMGLFKDINLVIDYISIETYFRFVLADLFPELNKILYLDADILVNADLGNLWAISVADYYAAGVEDPHILMEGYKKEIGFTNDDLYVNAGMLLLNLKKIRNDGITEKLFENIAKYPKIRYQDQDIINITLKNKIKKLDITNNFTWEYQQNNREKFDEAVIVHFTGVSKPWLSYGLGDRPFWFYVYDQYVDDFGVEIDNRADLRKDSYGLFTYTTENVGDDIQSIAARQFLPRVDYYIDRDFIDGQNYKNAKRVKLIMNGWYTHHPENWPPKSHKIDPLLIAMYFSSMHSERVKKAILSEDSRRFLKKAGPLGVRDYSTKEFFQQNKIESYFSGCLTLTIRKSLKLRKQDYVLAVDVPERVLTTMRQQTKRRIISVTPELMTRDMSPHERLRTAEWFLSMMQSAHCVVTTRLHSALPSLALETPVLFMLKSNHRETDRFKGLIELTYSLGEEEYLADPRRYNINKPPKNKPDYKKLRASLINKCESYTGYINNGGFLTGELPFSWDDYDFIQRLFDSLHASYRYQNLNYILTSKSEYATTEIEQYARHLKIVEEEYPKLENRLNEIQHKYIMVTRLGRVVKRGLRARKKG